MRERERERERDFVKKYIFQETGRTGGNLPETALKAEGEWHTPHTLTVSVTDQTAVTHRTAGSM